jgi:hypothetical protein
LNLSSPSAIGNTTPNTGAFTNLSATGTVSGSGFTNLLSGYATTSSLTAYLTSATAASTYLTTASAASNYLPIANITSFSAWIAGFATATSAWTPVVFPNIDFNSNNCYNPSNGVFTVPTTGLYQFNIGGFMTQSAGGAGNRYGYAIFVNGSQAAIGGGVYSSVDDPLSGFTNLQRLSAGNTVSVYVFSAVATTWGAQAGYRFFFQGHYICP